MVERAPLLCRHTELFIRHCSNRWNFCLPVWTFCSRGSKYICALPQVLLWRHHMDSLDGVNSICPCNSVWFPWEKCCNTLPHKAKTIFTELVSFLPLNTFLHVLPGTTIMFVKVITILSVPLRPQYVHMNHPMKEASNHQEYRIRNIDWKLPGKLLPSQIFSFVIMIETLWRKIIQ